MSDYVVVDASLAVKWVADEEGSDAAHALRETWESDGVQIAAPRMLLNEVANALLQKISRGHLPQEEAVQQMRRFATFPIEYHEWPGLHARAIELARIVAHPAVYDPLYLAVAERLDCELWLVDGPFYHRALPAGYSVRLLPSA